MAAAAGRPAAARGQGSAPARPPSPAPAAPAADPATARPGILGQARANGERAGSATRRFLKKPKPTLAPRERVLHETGGVLFGLIVYSLVINGIRYGQAGVTGWLKAKFVNRPMQGLPNSSAGGGGGGPSPGDTPSESPVSTPSGGVSA